MTVGWRRRLFCLWIVSFYSRDSETYSKAHPLKSFFSIRWFQRILEFNYIFNSLWLEHLHFTDEKTWAPEDELSNQVRVGSKQEVLCFSCFKQPVSSLCLSQLEIPFEQFMSLLSEEEKVQVANKKFYNTLNFRLFHIFSPSALLHSFSSRDFHFCLEHRTFFR